MEKERYQNILIVGPQDFIDYYVDVISLIDCVGGEYSRLVHEHITKIKKGRSTGINLFTGSYQRSTMPDLEWDAGCLVHDAQHREDFKNRPLWWSWFCNKEAEISALEIQNKFYKEISYPEMDIESVLATKYWLEIFDHW